MYAALMGKMIQIRNVPDELHRELKSRAALMGLSLSDYLLRELERIGNRPDITVTLARARARAEQTQVTHEEVLAVLDEIRGVPRS